MSHIAITIRVHPHERGERGRLPMIYVHWYPICGGLLINGPTWRPESENDKDGY